MKIRSLVILLAANLLTTGIAFAQQATTQVVQEPMENIFQLLSDGGYLGVYAEDITRENMSRYNLSQPRGVAVTQVMKDSPAEKAGIRKDDVILRIDSESVTNVRKLNRLVSEMAPDQTAKVSLSRAGSAQEVTVTIGKREMGGSFHGFMTEKPEIWKWEGPLTSQDNMVFAFGGSRRIGVSTTELTSQLAEFFGVSGGKGILVTSVSQDGPAAKAGLRAGDVITSVDGEPVDSTGDISRIINKKKEGNVTITIIRNKSQQTLQVTPTDTGSKRRTVIGSQIGRTIVIPRIEFPTMPDIDVNVPDITVPAINVSVPAITIPAVPSVNIKLPRITVPRVKVVRTASGPI